MADNAPTNGENINQKITEELDSQKRKAATGPFGWWNRLIQATYDWALNMASKRHALWILALVSFVESSFFPIPPDVLLLPMVLAKPKKAFKIAGVCTIASVIGGFFGYAIGLFLYDVAAAPILDFYGYLDKFTHFKALYNEWGAWIVAGAGMTPFPYKVITIASGVTELNIAVFGVASLLSRGFRFFVIAALLWKWGAPMKVFIEKNLGKLATLFFVLLIGSFVLLKYL